MYERKQTNFLRSNTSLTQSFISICSKYRNSLPRHDNLDEYTSTLSCSQAFMFRSVTSFNQNLSTWDVSSVKDFVSGLGPCDSVACWCRYTSSCLVVPIAGWSIVVAAPDLSAWLLYCSRCNTIIVMLKRNNIMYDRKQTKKLLTTIKHKSHTISFFSPTSQYHHCSHNDGLEQYGITTSTLCSQGHMFRSATSFNGDISTWNTSSATSFVSDLGT